MEHTIFDDSISQYIKKFNIIDIKDKKISERNKNLFLKQLLEITV